MAVINDITFVEDFILLFKNQSGLIIERLQPTCLRVIFSLMVIDLTIDMLFDQSDENIFLKLIRKCMFYGIYITFIQQYKVIINDYVLKGFIQLGNLISTGNPSTDFLVSPSDVVSDILAWIAPILTTSTLGQMALDLTGIESIPIGLIGCTLFLLGTAFKITCSMVMCFARFYIISSCGIILLPFAVFKEINSIGKGVLQMLIKQGVNLMVMILVINMMGNSLKFEGEISFMKIILAIGQIIIWYALLSEVGSIVNEIFGGFITGSLNKYGGGVQNTGGSIINTSINRYKEGGSLFNTIFNKYKQ